MLSEGENHTMKWIVTALVFSLPLFSMSKPESQSSHLQHVIEEREKKPQPPPFDSDLFRKDAQIYSVHAELLYWTVAEGALDYALTMKDNAWGTPSYAQGTFQTAGYDMDPGFRIALLYFRAPHYWEVKWQYTRIANEGHDHASKPAPAANYLTGTWPQIFTDPVSSATSHIRLFYDVFDMAVSRVFFPNPHLRLRILGGATIAWLEQDWKVRYGDGSSNSTVIRNKWQYIGGGLKTGSMADWYWTGELYMTGLWSFGLLMGTYDNQAKQTSTFQPNPAYNPNVPLRKASYSDIRPVFTGQMLLGPSWQRNYPKNRIEVFAGFEMNVWFNLQEIYRSTSGSASQAKETWLSTSLLSLYGLTTRVTVDF